MPNITRLSYASTTSSTPASIRQDLVNILAEARHYNSAHNIHGVMFYGNNYFFQCIEGDKQQIDALYAKIASDPRHKQLVQLAYEDDVAPLFAQWAMKYVFLDEKVQQFYKNFLWEKFNPYALQGRLLAQFLELLSQQIQDNESEQQDIHAQVLTDPKFYKYHLLEEDTAPAPLLKRLGKRRLEEPSLLAISRAKTYSRFIYASTSTALPSTIRDDLITIRTMAETLASQGEMFGVLVYGNNYYLHCIEAPDVTVDKIWEIAQQSELNVDVQLLSREVIKPQERFFNSWTLKYFLKEEPMQRFFHGQNWQKFDPYLLQGDYIDDFFKVLAGYEETISPIHAQHVAQVRAKNAGNSSGMEITPFMYFMMILGVFLILYALYYTALQLNLLSSSTF